jgi:drug/metabolite transporter (DMT)-like permease
METANGLGIALSLATAVLWAISPMFMGSVARRIGSHPTNLLRLLIAGTFFLAFLLPLYLLLHRGFPFPTREQWFWLILSGLVGILAGDACFYEALVLLGPRRAIKVNNVAPVFALAIGWVWQGERLTHRARCKKNCLIVEEIVSVIPAAPSPSRATGNARSLRTADPRCLQKGPSA